MNERENFSPRTKFVIPPRRHGGLTRNQTAFRSIQDAAINRWGAGALSSVIPPMAGNHAIIVRCVKPNDPTNNQLARPSFYPLRYLAALVFSFAVVLARRARRTVHLAAGRRIVDPAPAPCLRGPVPRARATPGPGSSQPRRGARPETATGGLGVDPGGSVIVRRPALGLRADPDSSAHPERPGSPSHPTGHEALGTSAVRRSRSPAWSGRNRPHRCRPAPAPASVRWFRRTAGRDLGSPFGILDRRLPLAGLRDFPTRFAGISGPLPT